MFYFIVGEQHVLYWADVSAEIAFVVPTRWNLQQRGNGYVAGDEPTQPDGSSASLASSTSSSSTAAADVTSQYERTVSFGPAPTGAVGVRTALGQKPRTLSLELEGSQKSASAGSRSSVLVAQSPQMAATGGVGQATAANDPIAPARRRTGLSKQPVAASGAKIMLVWLESFEDHLTLPTGEWDR